MPNSITVKVEDLSMDPSPVTIDLSTENSSFSTCSSYKKTKIRRISHMVNKSNQIKLEKKQLYSEAFKKGNICHVNKKDERTIQELVDDINMEYDLRGEDDNAKVTSRTVRRYIQQGKIGLSPKKKGPEPTKILSFFLELINCHINAMQCSDEEIGSNEIKGIIGAAIIKTSIYFNVDYCFRKLLSTYPHTLEPKGTMFLLKISALIGVHMTRLMIGLIPQKVSSSKLV